MPEFANARDWHAHEREVLGIVHDPAEHPDVATKFSEAGHAIRGCRGCPGVDDHPRIHVGPFLYHLDCLPPIIEADATRDADNGNAQHAAARDAINAAKSGKHGDELRAHLTGPHHEKHAPLLAAWHASFDEKPVPLADINAIHAANVAAGREPLAEPLPAEQPAPAAAPVEG